MTTNQIAEITIEQATGGNMTWGDIVRRYKPDATDEFVSNLLWNETCYPFSAEACLKQIHILFVPPVKQ